MVDIGGSTYYSNFKLLSHNLNVPLVLKYNLLGRPWVFFEGGIQPGVLFTEKYTSKDKNFQEDMNDIKPDFNVFDFQLLGGIEFYLGSGFSVNARYFHGLTNVIDSDLNLKNRGFQFSLAYNLWQFH